MCFAPYYLICFLSYFEKKSTYNLGIRSVPAPINSIIDKFILAFLNTVFYCSLGGILLLLIVEFCNRSIDLLLRGYK